MKERQRHKLPHTMHIEPGDMLTCTINDRETKKTYEFREKIGRRLVVDTIVTFDVDAPVLGLVDGIGAIFGRSE